MPFITQERRMLIKTGDLDQADWQPGDRCYVYYKEMVDRWKSNPRWTTVHVLCKDMLDDSPNNDDDLIARDLAWQVFFQLHVMPYELEKMEMNGDI